MSKSNKTKIVFPINGVGTIGHAQAKKKKESVHKIFIKIKMNHRFQKKNMKL